MSQSSSFWCPHNLVYYGIKNNKNNTRLILNGPFFFYFIIFLLLCGASENFAVKTVEPWPEHFNSDCNCLTNERYIHLGWLEGE